jgi:hypothetical protein
MLSKSQARPLVVPQERWRQRASPGLTFPHFRDVAATYMTTRWVIESVIEPDGDEGIIVMQASANDADGPTLAIWEHEGSFRVDELRWDTYVTIARCQTIAEAFCEVARRMNGEHPAYRN